MAHHPADSATPKGEPWVWFTSLGLIVGLVMVVGLLGLVLVNGFSVFWAPQVPTVKLADGTTHIGQLAQRRIRPGSPASDPRFERQYQVGLKELNGNSYVWVDEKKVAALIGEKIGRADADFVREKTGFAIGGVPPVGPLPSATLASVPITRCASFSSGLSSIDIT